MKESKIKTPVQHLIPPIDFFSCLLNGDRVHTSRMRIFADFCVSWKNDGTTFNFVSNNFTFSSTSFAVEIYLSPVETHCSNVDYFPDHDDDKLLQPNDDATTRLHLARSCVALFILRY